MCNFPLTFAAPDLRFSGGPGRTLSSVARCVSDWVNVMSKSMGRVVVALAISVGSVVGVGAGTALAGEITGNGREKPVHGRSICAFSGQNDEFHAGEEGAERVQSYGQEVRNRRIPPQMFNPGDACNPNAEGGEG